MSGPGDILIKVGAETAAAVRELSNVNKALDDTASTHQRMGAAIQKAAVPAAAALTAIAGFSVEAAHAAAEHAAEQDKLAHVLERTTGATSEQAASMNDWIEHLSEATGVSQDELGPAMGTLATSIGSVSGAQKALNEALDVSAATGRSVTSISEAMAKAHNGNLGALYRLVPGISAAAKASKDYSVVMAEVAQKTGGAMTESTKTAAGQYEIFTNQMKILNEQLGAIFLPILQAVIPLMTKAAEVAGDHTKAIQILVGVVGALSVGILALNAALKAYEIIMNAVKVATEAWTLAQRALDFALAANPIGVVIVAVAALAAAIVVAYERSATFRRIVQEAFGAAEAAISGAFHAITAAASAAWSFIEAHWRIGAFAFGPLGAAIVLLVDHFGAVEKAGVAAFNAVSGAVNAVLGPIEAAIRAVEDLIHALGNIHVPSIHIPNPFSLPAGSPGPAPAVAGYAAGSSSGSSYTINVYGAVDPEGTARAIRGILAAHDRRQGRS